MWVLELFYDGRKYSNAAIDLIWYVPIVLCALLITRVVIKCTKCCIPFWLAHVDVIAAQAGQVSRSLYVIYRDGKSPIIPSTSLDLMVFLRYHILHLSFLWVPYRNLASVAFTAIIVLTATFLFWLVELHVCVPWIAFSVTHRAVTLVWSKTFSCQYPCTFILSMPLWISDAVLQPNTHRSPTFCNTSSTACSPGNESRRFIALNKHNDEYDQSLIFVCKPYNAYIPIQFYLYNEKQT